MLVVVTEPRMPAEDLRTKSLLPELLATRRRLRQRSESLVPHRGPTDDGPAHEEQTTGAGKTGTLRAAIFGMNDGLVSNVALIMGFAGASQARTVILLAGVSGLLAGAFSMAAGEYVSMRVQREVLERMLHLEAHELANEPEEELAELAEIYERKGVPADLALTLATELSRDPTTALDTHAREELGIDPDEGLGSPWAAAASSFVTFALGALVPLVPFLFTAGGAGVATSALVTGLALLGVGALTARLTGRSAMLSGLRMLAIGASAALITYLIGAALGVSVVG
jgi:vacuolar iron transporter family protein